MAHQAHRLPWNTLAANFDQVRLANGETLFAPLGRSNQGKEITYFTVAFARSLAGFSSTERHKYPKLSRKHRVNDDDEIVSEEAAQRLKGYFYDALQEGLNAEDSSMQVTAPPFPLRHQSVEAYITAPAWYEPPRSEEEIASYSEELVKKNAAPLSARCFKGPDKSHDEQTFDALAMWLILGEMETLLNIARYAPETVKAHWFWHEFEDTYGLKHLMERTLTFYVGLNLLYCKPDWYADGLDAWQSYFDPSLMHECRADCFHLERHRTGWPFSNPNAPLTTGELPPLDVVPIQFIRRKDYRSTPIWNTMLSEFKCNNPLGQYDRVTSGFAWAIPHARFFSTEAVLWGRWPAGARSPLVDPLKHGGGQRLKEYLKLCWDILVRLDVLMREIDVPIDWQQEVADTVQEWYLREPINQGRFCTSVWVGREPGVLDMSRVGYHAGRFV